MVTEQQVKEALKFKLMEGTISPDDARAKLMDFRQKFGGEMPVEQAQPIPEMPPMEVGADPMAFQPDAVGGLPGEQMAAIPEPQAVDSLVVAFANNAYQRSQARRAARTQRKGERRGLGQQLADMGAAAKEAFTGEDRQTEHTRTLPGWQSIPEVQEFAMSNIGPSFKTAMGTMFSGDQESILKSLQANYPDLNYFRDAKGNPIIQSPSTGEFFAVAPGVGLSDAPAIAAQGLTMFGGPGAIAKGARYLPKAMQGMQRGRQAAALAAQEGLTQGVIEGAKEIGGVDGSLLEVGGAALGGGAVGALTDAYRAGKGAAGVADELQPIGEPLPQQAVGDSFDAQKIAEMPFDEKKTDEMGKLMKDAALGSRKAQRILQQEMEINKASRDWAKSQGFDFIPSDVFSDNPQVRAGAGLGRSVVTSGAEADWKRTVTKAVDHADELMEEAGASFFGGGPSTANVSDQIMFNLKQSRDELAKESGELYEEVGQVMPKSTVIELGRLENALMETMEEVGEGGLNAQERKLLKLIDGDEPITYGRLIREKSSIGEALSGKQNDYTNINTASLKKMYAALAEDQIEAVGAVSAEAKEKLIAANLIYGKKSKLEEDIVAAFGKDGMGSLGKRLQNMIVSSSNQDQAMFNRTMKMIPQDLKKKALMTAIAGATRSKRGLEKGGFGFSEFANVWGGLRKNESVMGEIGKELGDEAMNMFEGLFDFSKRFSDARANVIQTGKANQGLDNVMAAEGLVASGLRWGERLADWAPGVGNIPRDGIGWAADLASKGGDKAKIATGDLFRSPDFNKGVDDLLDGTATPEQVAKRLSYSRGFRSWFNAGKSEKETPEKIERWILASMRAERNLTDDENGNENQ